jgi:hypothetical protein
VSGAHPPFRSTQRSGSESGLRRPGGCFLWLRPFPPDLRRRLPSFVRSLHRYYGPIRLLIHVHARRAACGLPEPARTGVRARMRSPRFRTKDVSTCMGSPTARGSSSASQLRREDVAFSSAERDRHLGIRPVSQLNTQPVVSPVNASRRPSRDAAHHSGPGRLAKPFPVEDLHLLSFASLSWRTPLRVTSRCEASSTGGQLTSQKLPRRGRG